MAVVAPPGAVTMTMVAVVMIADTHMNACADTTNMGADADIRARGGCPEQAQSKYGSNDLFHGIVLC